MRTTLNLKMRKWIRALVPLVFAVGCSSEPSEKLVPFVEKKIIKKSSNVDFFPSVDILFIVDDSGSMSEFQNNIAKNSSDFVDTFLNARFLDFHVGVTTSTAEFSSSSVASRGVLRSDAGISFVERTTPGVQDLIKEYIRVGSNGAGTEEFFNPLNLVFSSQNKVSNQGFHRPDAPLLIIFVTDTDDQSFGMTPMDAIQSVETLKGNDRSKVFVLTAAITEPIGNCVGENNFATRLLEFTNYFNGLSFNLCSNDYGTPMAAAAQEIVQRASTIKLNQIPQLDTMKLTFGRQVIPRGRLTGWTYNVERNEIYIGSEVELEEEPPGTRVKVLFEAVYK